MSDDLPRSMLEVWADIHGLDSLPDESDKDMRARIIARYIQPTISITSGAVMNCIVQPKKDILDITRDLINSLKKV